ncbi:MAG TPA: hypothetical protein VFP50_00540 [Anaeromyxobacteraceae bacterium]|nr:hypothetical protein [Anaeromyxobacteraceae bacterium]
MRRLASALLLALPAAAGAQGLMLHPPDIGEALHELDRHPRRDPGDLEQTFVVPERPGQNQVAWYRFDWEFIDVPAPGGGKGGIRLYYARSAEPQARRALPAIRSAYARLVAEFAYSPTRRIPYILYATQREFQTQNVFQVTESVLGVTSPQDLKMTVPYFGDHDRFLEVSTHEMVHQFTIQKMMDAADSDSLGTNIQLLPLWFVEGIAEFYTKGGLDVETDGFLRDLVWNPDPSKHYQVVDFADDRLRGYIPTYKLGQARIAFIAEVYGREKIQAFIENAYLLGDGGQGGGALAGQRNFGGLVRRVLSEPVEQVDARWHAWLKKRYFAEYGRVQQDLPQVRELRGLPGGEVEAFTASPDGNAVLARVLDREKGRARVVLADLRNPRGALEVAEDSVPGAESLHPIDYNVLALAEGVLAYSAQAGSGDVLTVRRWRRLPVKEEQLPKLQLGRAHRLEIRAPGGGTFYRIADPAFSSDASHIAFVGVAADGQQDVYVVAAEGGEARRLTDDFFAERDLAWGPDGIYCSSDATDHGRFNLFRIDVATGARTRLTTAPADDRSPHPQADGSVLYTSTAAGKPDVMLLDKGTVRRVTDFTTGLKTPAVAPKARGILATTFHGGHFRLVEVPKVAWLDEPAVPVAPPAGEVLPIPAEELPVRPKPYEALALHNWRPETGIIFGGATGSAVAGRAAVLFDDYLRDHVFFLDLSIFGSLAYTQGLALFENRSRRTSWAVGAFHFVQQQLDRIDPALAYYQRDFGAVGALRFPLDRFQRFEVELTAGGVERYCLTDFSGALTLACGGVQTTTGPYPTTEAWRQKNGGVHPTLAPTLRYGYDSVRFDELTGPLDGSSALLEVGGGWLPTRQAVHGFARFDLGHWWQLVGRSNLMLRLAGATSFSPNETGRLWERSWWLSSADNLRGYSPFDLAYLIGQHYYVANLELQVPLDPVLKLVIFDTIEGVAALDFGGVFNRYETKRFADGSFEPGAWDSRTLTGVLGVNMLLGPLLLRLHFGHPYRIGGLETPALRFGDRWVTNFTIRYFFF